MLVKFSNAKITKSNETFRIYNYLCITGMFEVLKVKNYKECRITTITNTESTDN